MAGMLTNDTLPVSGNPNQGVQTRAGYAPRERGLAMGRWGYDIVLFLGFALR